MPVQTPYLSPELEQESEDVQRKRRMADALLQRGLTPEQGQMIGRFYVAPNTLNSAINAVGGAMMGKKLSGQQKDITARGEAQSQDELARVTRALRGTSAMMPPDPQENQQAADQGTPPVAPFQVQTQTPQQGLEEVLPSLRTPFGRNLAQGYIGSQIGQLGPQKPIVVGKSLVDPKTNKVILTDPSVAAESSAAQAARAAEAQRDREARAEQARLTREGRPQEPLVQVEGPNGPTWATREQALGQPAAAKPEKPLNEGQGKAVLFGTRAAAAHRTLSALEDSTSTTGLAAKQFVGDLPIVGAPLGVLGNKMLSAEQQKVDQAQRDFVNAVLRPESGASISPAEFENAKKQYFPQPGDSDAVRNQKRLNRQLEINGLRSMAGPGSKDIDAAIAALPKMPEKKTPKSREGDKPPAGVDAGVWAAMTPTERALFRDQD